MATVECKAVGSDYQVVVSVSEAEAGSPATLSRILQVAGGAVQKDWLKQHQAEHADAAIAKAQQDKEALKPVPTVVAP